MWITFAFGSAFFAGITAILAKVGMKRTDTTLVTAIRTIVVVIFSWIMVALTGSGTGITQISRHSLLFLILSGISTGASWLCYFKALQLGDVNKVTPIDKSSTVLTMILAVIFFHESLTRKTILAMALILIGTFLMITKKKFFRKEQRKKLASFCRIISTFCKSYVDSWENRNTKCRVESWNSHKNLRGSCDGLVGGFCNTQAKRDITYYIYQWYIYLFVRSIDGSFVALLLPCITGGTGKYCGAD